MKIKAKRKARRKAATLATRSVKYHNPIITRRSGKVNFKRCGRKGAG